MLLANNMFLTVCWMTRLLTTHTVIHMLQCTALAASKRCTHEIIKYTWIWQKSLLEWGPYFAIVQSKTLQILWNHCKHGKSVYLKNWSLPETANTYSKFRNIEPGVILAFRGRIYFHFRISKKMIITIFSKCAFLLLTGCGIYLTR